MWKSSTGSSVAGNSLLQEFHPVLAPIGCHFFSSVTRPRGDTLRSATVSIVPEVPDGIALTGSFFQLSDYLALDFVICGLRDDLPRDQLRFVRVGASVDDLL